MESLTKQLKFEIDNYVKKVNKKIDTVFIGGGTPSAVNHKEYEKVFDLIRPVLATNAEITTEANPNSATVEWLKGMFDFGVNRISFGVQSFDDEKLKFLGRSHGSSRAIKAIKDANSIGFKAINCDIIYGVEGDSFESLKKDFNIIENLPISHISAYSLTIEDNTKFANTRNVKIDDEILSQEIFDYLQGMGFEQYEISNFALNDSAQSKHNKGYWRYEEYLGIGAGAVGCKNNIRSYPHKDIEKYIAEPNFCEIEELSQEDIKVEKVLLGLRCSLGIDSNIFTQKEGNRVNELIEENKLNQIDNRIYNNNFLLADALALYILD